MNIGDKLRLRNMHGGTSFVKWDDGQVTSIYTRNLQKELV